MTGVEEVALVAMAAGAAVSAYGSYEQGQSQAAMGRYQAAVAGNNKIIADQYAQAEIQKGMRLEAAKRLETGQREGAIRAAAGANGLALDSGSPLRLQEDTARLGEMDAATIRDNSSRAAYGYQVQGLNYAAQAQADEMGAENAAAAGNLGMWSSIIGGASSVSGSWAKFKQAGATPFSG